MYCISKRLDFLRLGLWTLMLISLIASMRHVAWLYSTLELGSETAGWISAFSFDASVFLLTLIGVKYKQGTAQRRFIRVGIYTNAVISILANIMHGVEHQQELERVKGFLWQIIPYVFSFAVPLMVVFLAEVLSRQESELEAEVRKQQKKEAKTGQNSGRTTGRELTETERASGRELAKTGRLTKTERMEKVAEAVAEGKRSRNEIAEYTGVPKSSVGDVLNELYQTGRLVKNESGQPELPSSEQFRSDSLDSLVSNPSIINQTEELGA